MNAAAAPTIRAMRIALATCEAVPPEFDDDELLAEALRGRGAEAEFVSWDGRGEEWSRFDLVVVRSTWDYTGRLGEFLAWADWTGRRLRNPASVLRWNADKRYLRELEASGLAVVPTAFVEPGGAAPELAGEVVVKPTVSAGGRDTGRFRPAAHGEARALLRRLSELGRTAMVQPYLEAVDEHGETALVFVAGQLAHTLRKRAVLRPDEVAPLRDDDLGAAEAMYDPELVVAGESTAAERDLGARIIDHVGERFGAPPLYARVDLVPGPNGDPVVIELEAIEPCLYLTTSPETAERLAEAIVADVSEIPSADERMFG
jgi:hypothetical protein